MGALLSTTERGGVPEKSPPHAGGGQHSPAGGTGWPVGSLQRVTRAYERDETGTPAGSSDGRGGLAKEVPFQVAELRNVTAVTG